MSFLTHLRCGTTHGQDSWVEASRQIEEEEVGTILEGSLAANLAQGIRWVQDLE